MQTREFPQFRLRLPPELHDWIKTQAESNHRTKNSEVTFRLEASRKAEAAAGHPSKA